MVANRLTWKNVAAPDFSTALDGMHGAGQAWARGFDGLSGALGDWRTRQKDEASAEAMGKLLGINSTAGWDAAMAKGGGFAALGIKSSDANAALLGSMAGNRGTLLDNESTAVNTANNIAGQKIQEENQAYLNNVTRPQDAADRARAEAGWAQADLVTQDENAKYAKNKEDEATALYGKDHVEGVLKYSPYVTADDITTAINRNPDLTRKQKDAALAALPDVFAARTGVTATAANKVSNTPESTAITSQIDRAKEATARAAANNPLIADHALLNQEHTQDPQAALDELFAATTAANGGDNFASSEEFKTGSGPMAAFYQKMVTAGTSPDGSRLPPGLISKIIQNNLTDGGRYFFFGGGKVDKDEKKILDEINKFKDPDQVSAMYLSSQNYAAEQTQIAGMETKKGEFERIIALAEQNGETEQVKVLRAGYKKYVDDTTGVTADSEKAKKAADVAEAAIAKAAKITAAIGGGDPKNINAALAAQAEQAAQVAARQRQESAALAAFRQQAESQTPISVVDPALETMGKAATQIPSLFSSGFSTALNYQFPGASVGARKIGGAVGNVLGSVADQVIPESTPGPNIGGNLWSQTSETDKAYMLSSELDMPQADSSLLTRAAYVMETGVDPNTGIPLSDSEQQVMNTKVAEVIKKALKARGDLPLTPELAQLIASNPMWQSALGN